MTAALMYHDVVPAGAGDTSGFPGRDAALYKVTPERFESHLAAIRRSLPGQRGPALTFDDGGVSSLAAADALERFGMRGYFFATVDFIGRRGFLDWDGVRELHRRGHVIGSHSCSHPLRIGHCPWQQLVDEWARSRDVIANALGTAPATASVPGGDFAPPVARAAALAGFTTLFTSEPTAVPRQAFGLVLRGRYTIRRGTSDAAAAALAAGAPLACLRQTLAWNARKAGKRIAGARYLQLRRLLLGHSAEIQWGDREG